MGTSEHRTPQGKNTPKGGKATGNQTPQGKNTPKGGKATGNQTPQGKNTPKGGKQMTPKSPKFNKGSLNGKPQGNFKTPQPEKAVKAEGKKTPKSAPPAHIKRKKLEEEIDEKLSDDEFEKLLGHMKETKDKKKAVTEGSDDGDKDDDDEMSDFDLDDDDNEDISDDDEDDDDDSDDDDLLDDDEDDGDDSGDDDLLDDEAEEGDESDIEDEDEDDDDDDEEELAPAKKKLKSMVSPVTAAQKTKKQSAESKEKTKQKQAEVAKKEPKGASKQKSADKNILKESKPNKGPNKGNRYGRTVTIQNFPLHALVGDIMDQCANVDLIRFSFDPNNKEGQRGGGLATIRFKTEADAEKHQNILGSMTFKSKGMPADFQRERTKQQKAKPVGVDPKKLFVRGLPKNFSEEKLKSLFPGASSATMPGNKRRNNRYGFVLFSTEAAATDSLNKAQKKKLEFDGLTLVVQRANKSSSDGEEKKRSISEGEDDETDQAPAAKKQKKDSKEGKRPHAKGSKRR